jgi:hypothetical protein
LFFLLYLGAVRALRRVPSVFAALSAALVATP